MKPEEILLTIDDGSGEFTLAQFLKDNAECVEDGFISQDELDCVTKLEVGQSTFVHISRITRIS